MAEKKSKTTRLFDKYLAKMASIKKERQASQLYHELTSGKTSYMKLNRLATSYFDMTWIKAIEDVLFDLGDIVKNPREVTKTEAVLVPVELARKVSSESVRHLASHTQYIKTVDEKGEVVPNKIITIANEEDIHTYENRFIATLIRRLVLFIEKRYEFIKSFTPINDEQILYFKSESVVNGADVEIETKVKIRALSETNISEVSNKYIARIEDIREYVLYYYTSQFMKKLKTDRDVRNPIIMTNILRKNPKYHRCYELYRFIERYQQLGVSYKVDEQVGILDEEEIDELNTVMFTNYLAIQDAEHTRKVKETSRTYKPKILTSIDDEQFVYGELLKGPFNFVRIDDEYQAYLDSKIKKDLPLHPTKAEREYYAAEYADRKERKEDKAQIEKLKKRKSKEALENEKRIRKIIEEREREEALRRQQEEEARRLEEERRLDEVRREIIAAARGDVPEEEAKPEEAPVSEQPVEENASEAPVEEASSNKKPIEYDFHIVEINDSVEFEDIYADDKENDSIEKYILGSGEPVENVGDIEDFNIFKESVDGNKKPQKIKKIPITIDDFKNIEFNKFEFEDIYADDSEAGDADNYVRSAEVDNLSEEDIKALLGIKDEPVKQIKKAKKAKKKAQPVEEVVEPVVEEQPQEEPVSEVLLDEPQEEIPVEEKPKQEEVLTEEPVVNEEPIAEEPIEEPKKENKAPKKRSPRAKKAKAPKEETPVEEPIAEEPVQEEKVEESSVEEPQEEAPVLEQPVEESQPEEKVEETPVEETPEEEPITEEKPQEEPKKKPAKKKTHAKKAKKAPKKEPKEEPKEEVKEEEPEPIPGRFIVKTLDGYYVKEGVYSIYKHEAYIFDDFNKASALKKRLGGKVVKL